MTRTILNLSDERIVKRLLSESGPFANAVRYSIEILCRRLPAKVIMRQRTARGSKGVKAITHKFAGRRVSDILKQKKGSIKQAQLPEDSPSWDEFSQMTWEAIENGARANAPGFKAVRKLLTDKRFDR